MTLLEGGMGGRGNASYKTSTNRAPRQHQTGIPGEEMWVWLRLKLLADAGLVGLPNAGKSTFLNSASPTRRRQGRRLPVHDAFARSSESFATRAVEFVLADIPGLIEGAAEGAGIGDRFLGHVERTKLLLHLVDAAGDDPVQAWQTVRCELDAYGAGLDAKPEVLALSRADLVDDARLDELMEALEDAAGVRPFPISAPLEEGMEQLLDAVITGLGGEPAEPETAGDSERPWSPL